VGYPLLAKYSKLRRCTFVKLDGTGLNASTFRDREWKSWGNRVSQPSNESGKTKNPIYLGWLKLYGERFSLPVLPVGAYCTRVDILPVLSYCPYSWSIVYRTGPRHLNKAKTGYAGSARNSMCCSPTLGTQAYAIVTQSPMWGVRND